MGGGGFKPPIFVLTVQCYTYFGTQQKNRPYRPVQIYNKERRRRVIGIFYYYNFLLSVS